MIFEATDVKIVLGTHKAGVSSSSKELDGKWSPLESLESRHHFKGLKS